MYTSITTASQREPVLSQWVVQRSHAESWGWGRSPRHVTGEYSYISVVGSPKVTC